MGVGHHSRLERALLGVRPCLEPTNLLYSLFVTEIIIALSMPVIESIHEGKIPA